MSEMFLAVLIHVASHDIFAALVLNTQYAHFALHVPAHHKMLTVMPEMLQITYRSPHAMNHGVGLNIQTFLLSENIIV